MCREREEMEKKLLEKIRWKDGGRRKREMKEEGRKKKRIGEWKNIKNERVSL